MSGIDYSLIETPIKPYAHQYKIVEKVLSDYYCAIAAEMGLGKTKALIDSYRIRSSKENLVMLVLCPKSVIGSWVKDLTANNVLNFTVIDSDSSLSKRVKLFKEACHTENHVIVMNYDQILSVIEAPYDLVDWWVLDESHNIKNHQAQRTKRILGLSKQSSYRTIISGTMISNHPIDLWSQAWFLNPDIFNKLNYYAFRGRYCVMGGFENRQIIAYKNLEELKIKIDRFSIQLKKEDCLDLPEKVYQPRILKMTPELKGQYKQMVNDLVLELSDSVITATIAATKIIRLCQITSGVHLKGSNPKLDELEEIVTMLNDSNESVVVTYHFTETGSMIERLIKKLGIKYSKLDGSVRDRDHQIDMFQRGESKVFLGQDQATKEGITLTKARYMVCYETGYSMTVRKQIEDRIHRIGQKDTCFYIDLCYGGTIDVAIQGAIKKKQDVATFLVDSFKKGGGDFTKGEEKGSAF